jgi:serine/threonine protein kinase
VMLYEMITGELPFADLRAAFVQQSTNTPAPRMKERDIPDALDAIIVRAMSNEPNDRPSADEMATVLATTFSLEMPVSQPGVQPIEPVSPDAETMERVFPDDLHERETEEM